MVFVTYEFQGSASHGEVGMNLTIVGSKELPKDEHPVHAGAVTEEVA